jgi:hypothetical protein
VGRAKIAAVASRFLDTGVLPGPVDNDRKGVWRTRPDAVVTGWSERELAIGAERAERARLNAPRLAAEKEAKEFQDALLLQSSRRGGSRRGGSGDRRRPHSFSPAAREAEAWKASFERFSRHRGGGGGGFGDCGEDCGGCGHRGCIAPGVWQQRSASRLGI